ncbi:putative Mg2+ transporter-C (MgtC) family protein [Parelusimicrobium proximum]|uniref:MgtC/SapB family protein n=1 Tax=Parelusimicrobium proximum TaxID=3228953 RepID=UPI003D17F03F
MNELVIIERVFIALLAGGVIGIEREYHDKPAGFTTNCLICLGACIFTLLSLLMGTKYGFDPGRISAQIITGVGFIGAGSILRDGNKITGLTTAASVWLVAALGMAVGYGEYSLAAVAVAGVLALQMIMKKASALVLSLRRYDVVHIVCEPSWSLVEKISKLLEKDGVKIIKRTVEKENGYFVMTIMASYTSHDFEKMTKDLFEMPEVRNVTRQ